MNIILSIPALAWLIISALFFAFGEFLSKKFALAPSIYYVLIIIGIYALGTLSWLPAIFQKNQLSVVGAIWSVLSLIATILIGLSVFNEKLTLTQSAGLVLGLVAVYLLSR